MKTSIDCIPCFLRQTLDAARMITDDPSVHESIIREVIGWIHDMDFNMPPPAVGQRIHRRLKELTGIDDPYRAAKNRQTETALSLFPIWLKRVRESSDPFELAVKLSIAANIIDLGAKTGLLDREVPALLEQATVTPLSGDIEAFRQTTRKSRNILYLADNTGEIVFDRFLISLISPSKVTLAVRGYPIINDATVEDAMASGLHDLVEVIDNGSDVPGTILADCSPEFRARFETADLIIAKGQGNYETLSNEEKNIYFLFKAKCPVIAADVGVSVGAHVLSHQSDLLDIENPVEEREI